MKNKSVGYMVLGIAIVMLIMIFAFNVGLKKIVGETCTHGPTCTMYSTISLQTWISAGIVGLLIIVGLFLIFSKQDIKIITKFEKKKKISLEGLDKKEKEVVKIVQEKGGIFQAELMEKLSIGKVGITRLLDKLEAKQIVERKRRGMNNFVVLKG